jgi:sugar transferase EpsL
MERDVERAMKRVIDVTGASAGLLVLAPVIGAAALLVAITMGRPVLFRQLRPGLGGRPFTMYKIRTMRPSEPGEVYYLTDGERLTPAGRFLRRTSIDELPELWNVLKGEMSLVGPRPLLMEYLGRYSPEQARRHDVRPGITGWAQVNGRQEISFKERFELDIWYVDNWSLKLDMKILFKTLGRVIHSSGVVIGQVDQGPVDEALS